MSGILARHHGMGHAIEGGSGHSNSDDFIQYEIPIVHGEEIPEEQEVFVGGLNRNHIAGRRQGRSDIYKYTRWATIPAHAGPGETNFTNPRMRRVNNPATMEEDTQERDFHNLREVTSRMDDAKHKGNEEMYLYYRRIYDNWRF